MTNHPIIFLVTTHPWGTFQVGSWDGETGDEHCGTPQEQHRSREGTESPTSYGPVMVKDV